MKKQTMLIATENDKLEAFVSYRENFTNEKPAKEDSQNT